MLLRITFRTVLGVQVKQQETDDRLLVSDYETGDFYGFNTTYFTK